MSYLPLFLFISTVIAFMIYFYNTRKLIRKLIDSNIALQLAGNKLQRELTILTDQYRQLANINKAFMTVTKTKKEKKK